MLTKFLVCPFTVDKPCRSEYGRLGLGPGTGDANVPTLVSALAECECVDVACGTTVSFAITQSGSSRMLPVVSIGVILKYVILSSDVPCVKKFIN